VKKLPLWPNPHFIKINTKTCIVEKSSPRLCATSVIFENLPKENDRLIGENSPYLVALDLTDLRHVCTPLKALSPEDIFQAQEIDVGPQCHLPHAVRVEVELVLDNLAEVLQQERGTLWPHILINLNFTLLVKV
jgi:hypothetical protein